MNNKGYIATSLIYTFLIVVTIIMGAMSSNYIYNRTMLSSFNREVMSELNNQNKNITIYSYKHRINNGNIKDNVYYLDTKVGNNVTEYSFELDNKSEELIDVKCNIGTVNTNNIGVNITNINSDLICYIDRGYNE